MSYSSFWVSFTQMGKKKSCGVLVQIPKKAKCMLAKYFYSDQLLTCGRNRLSWWWGWAASHSETRIRCSSIWRPCCYGDSRKCRSCCPRVEGSGNRSDSAPCGRSKAHTLWSAPRELQRDKTEEDERIRSIKLSDFKQLVIWFNVGWMTSDMRSIVEQRERFTEQIFHVSSN